ncbi:MAG: Grx4 family monothiol glutaredoxin [Nitrososphaerales archaeon]|jgi:monothiol glutaredoxin|nr:Grx4 family monothiol glutaredoxin [Nitrososphaerales archaeon]
MEPKWASQSVQMVVVKLNRRCVVGMICLVISIDIRREIMTMKEKIINDIENNSIILYMKGTQERPMCGFSARVVNTLNSHSVVFQDVNVLEDPEIRVRLSEYSNWPTIPQLFVNGELIGGCDIVMEMESKGELKDVLKKTEA